MPQFQATVIDSKQVWASPDGQRTMFEVTMQVNGQTVVAKTWSGAVSKIGWSGQLESYDKANNQGGTDTFVKQPQKEGGFGGKSGGAKFEKDPFTMYLSYAKDVAVAMLKDGKLDEDAYGKVLEAVLSGGQALFAGRPSEKTDAPLPTQQPVDDVHTVTDEPIDMKSLNDLFPEDK